MSTSPSHDDDFVTKTTKHRKKQQQVITSTAGGDEASENPSSEARANGNTTSSNTSNISLRPRTMFAMKGRGRTDSETSAYRPQWSKDGEGFVSSGGPTTKDTTAVSGQDEHRGERRKNKVLRYTKKEILALHFTTTEPPKFAPETTVASEHSLPPVSTLPFDYEEIYKQWSLNRNRGRGRGRGNATSGGQQNTRGHQDSRGPRGEEGDNGKQKDEHHRINEKERTWERGAKVVEDGNDVWDDVLEPGVDSNEMDLSSMAEAAEKFRREMDAMREELNGSKPDMNEIKEDLDAFDKKLEDAAAAGQFDDSDNEEVQWDDRTPEKNTESANSPSDKRNASSLGQQSDSSGLLDVVEPSFEKARLDELSNLSISQVPTAMGLSGLSPHVEVEENWFYLDPQGLQQGPFKTAEMREWFEAGYFKPHLPIRFGHEGVFTPLANQFAHGQMPFTVPPTRNLVGMRVDSRQSEQHRLLELQREQQRQQQQQQMLDLQQQQRMLQRNHEEMQRLEIARQQQQTQLYQHQQMLQHQHEQQRQRQQQQQQMLLQQQQQMLLQQQGSWQRSQREGIMNTLGIYGGSQNSEAVTNDNLRPNDMQIQFQSDYRIQHNLNLQSSQPLNQDTILNGRTSEALWPNASTDRSDVQSGSSILGRMQSPQRSTPVSPQNPIADPVTSAWAVVSKSPERPVPPLHDIQMEQAHEDNTGDYHADVLVESTSPVNSEKETKSGIGEKLNSITSPLKVDKPETNAWVARSATMVPSTTKSLKEIQLEEQRERLNKMNESKGSTANLAQMGAQLKMMLGVNSTGGTSNSNELPMDHPAPTPSAPTLGPWGSPANVTTGTISKSMRDILAEEERLAQERAKANENASKSSHWMNVVAGNKVAAAAIPKPSRSVLGPVPASVLKSRQQVRPANGSTKSSPSSDATFWNFGVAQSAGDESSSNVVDVSSSNDFGSDNVSSEFMTWALKQLKSIDSDADVTLLKYCASVDDPGEIREYLAAYMGSTPRVSAFATEFIQRKKSYQSGKKSPSRQQAQQRPSEAGSSNKRGKRRIKGQKIDLSLLNYSVGS